MNKMNDILQYLEYKDKKIPLAFTLNVMAAMQKEYGSYEAWQSKLISESGEPDAEALIFGFTEMLNEGISIENDENGTDNKLLLPRQVGRIITEIGMQKAFDKLTEAQKEATKSDEKNG